MKSDSNDKVVCMAKERELWAREFMNVYAEDD